MKPQIELIKIHHKNKETLKEDNYKNLQFFDEVWTNLISYYHQNQSSFKKIKKDEKTEEMSQKLFSSTTDLWKSRTKPFDLNIYLNDHITYITSNETHPILKTQEIFFTQKIAIIKGLGHLKYVYRHMNPQILNYFDIVIDSNNHQTMDLKIKFFKNNPYEKLNKLFYSMLFFDQNSIIAEKGIYTLVNENLSLLNLAAIYQNDCLEPIIQNTEFLKEKLILFIDEYQDRKDLNIIEKIQIAQKGLKIINKNLSMI